jgi:VWFA-related protein
VDRRDLLKTLASLATANILRGQDTPSPTFSSKVKVVNLYATVRNGNGEIVRNLNKEDFLLKEDGRPQEITYFSRESNLPLTIGFVVDTSGSTRKVLPEEKTAARTFIDQVLREDKDHAFVIHFDKEVELLRDLTSSRPKLQKAIDELETSERLPDPGNGGGSGNGRGGGGGGGMGWPGGGIGWPGGGGGGGGRRGGGGNPSGAARRGGTLLYDAVLLASDEIMKKQTGRKALILLSDGEDTGSKTTLRSAISSAQRSDSLIYTVFFKGESGGFQRGGFGGRGRGGGGSQDDKPDGKKIMQQLAAETGGAMIPVTSKTPVDKAFAQIGDELRSQYSLGYSSDNKSADSDFRKITLIAKPPGLSVQTRDGYWPDGE